MVVNMGHMEGAQALGLMGGLTAYHGIHLLVAFRELVSTYHSSKTLLSTTYPYYGNLDEFQLRS